MRLTVGSDGRDHRPTCPQCRQRPLNQTWVNAAGIRSYRSLCELCRREKVGKGKNSGIRGYRWRALQTYPHVCVRCGFIPEHVCQIHVDHINGNHHDNRPENWQLLCANCHELKTVLSGDRFQKRESG